MSHDKILLPVPSAGADLPRVSNGGIVRRRLISATAAAGALAALPRFAIGQAPDTSACSNTSRKCDGAPAPPEAIRGMVSRPRAAASCSMS